MTITFNKDEAPNSHKLFIIIDLYLFVHHCAIYSGVSWLAMTPSKPTAVNCTRDFNTPLDGTNADKTLALPLLLSSANTKTFQTGSRAEIIENLFLFSKHEGSRKEGHLNFVSTTD